jgi:hypothetical protein
VRKSRLKIELVADCNVCEPIKDLKIGNFTIVKIYQGISSRFSLIRYTFIPAEKEDKLLDISVKRVKIRKISITSNSSVLLRTQIKSTGNDSAVKWKLDAIVTR